MRTRGAWTGAPWSLETNTFIHILAWNAFQGSEQQAFQEPDRGLSELCNQAAASDVLEDLRLPPSDLGLQARQTVIAMLDHPFLCKCCWGPVTGINRTEL